MAVTATHYSAHVSRREADCHCGCTTPLAVQHELALTAQAFELVRALHGGPLGISNAYRCAAQNARVGGSKNSAHMRGIALDITAPRQDAASVNALAALAEKVAAFKKGGIGRYFDSKSFFVHCDRWHDPAFRPARWEEH